jgi:hypothetical protein
MYYKVAIIETQKNCELKNEEIKKLKLQVENLQKNFKKLIELK